MPVNELRRIRQQGRNFGNSDHDYLEVNADAMDCIPEAVKADQRSAVKKNPTSLVEEWDLPERCQDPEAGSLGPDV